MERQRKRRWRKTASVFSPAAVTQAKILTSSDFDNRRCQPPTPSFSRCFSHSLYSYLWAVLILSATIWLCLSPSELCWRRQCFLCTNLVCRVFILIESEPHPAPADPHAHTKPTWHSHEFWVTVLRAHAVRMYVIRCNSMLFRCKCTHVTVNHSRHPHWGPRGCF